MDMDQHAENHDDQASQIATDLGTQLTAGGASTPTLHQGQAAAQQARPTSRAKPKNWIFMNTKQRKNWNKYALKIDKRKQR
jgi:hypothetical protein